LPPTLDPRMAVTFMLLERHAQMLLPPPSLEHARPYFDNARHVLATGASVALRRWPEKIRVLPPGLPLTPKPIRPEVYDVVYHATLDERRFEAVYRNAKGQTKTHVVHPLALIERGGLLYVVCTVGEKTTPIQLALWRVRSARALEEPSRRPNGFDIDTFIREGEVGVRLAPEAIDLRFRIRRDEGGFLLDLDLAEDQRVREEGEWLVVEARTAYTRELRHWLHGFADLLEVLAPEWLRAEFAGRALAAARAYERG
jgi:predicted DNA-binding transcriptional regulator YafY